MSAVTRVLMQFVQWMQDREYSRRGARLIENELWFERMKGLV
jgi:hypothetical protein